MPSVRICRLSVTVELSDEVSSINDLILKAVLVADQLEVPSAGSRPKPAPTDKSWLEVVKDA